MRMDVEYTIHTGRYDITVTAREQNGRRKQIRKHSFPCTYNAIYAYASQSRVQDDVLALATHLTDPLLPPLSEVIETIPSCRNRVVYHTLYRLF